jgi:single-strand DNA-binding protein
MATTDEVMGMNETYVTISGNVVGDPQVRRTRADVPFVTFRVASNVRRVDHKTGEYIDAGTNFVNVTAFRSLGINLANSLEKGHPVVVYGRMRINQWTNGERTGTTVEIDAYNVGHDLARGQSTFVRVARPQLEQHDRLADPAVQQAGEALDGSGDDPEAGDEPGDDDAAPYGLQLAAEAGDDVQPEGDGFDVDAADTDAYEVVGAAS